MDPAPSPTSDLRVASFDALPSPAELLRADPLPEAGAAAVARARQSVQDILTGADPRFLVVVGPCSIHDPEAALEYARRLQPLAAELGDQLFLLMRVYFEKPRTTVGWKGLILDPHLDDSCDLPAGLRTARHFLNEVVALGLPAATEFLDPITPQYLADLVAWAGIGARTSESQTHRQMASGLSMPVGFKNTTSGALQPALNAIRAARAGQTFLGINPDGQACSVTTRGNPHGHLILRGGSAGPNYDEDSRAVARAGLEKIGLAPRFLVDCSHDNSGKSPGKQPGILADLIEARARGEDGIAGAMLESNLQAGNQPFPQPVDHLLHGVSITDGCLDWESTEAALRAAAETLRTGAPVT